MERVIVTGAGVMGLVAAYELGKAGYKVEVFEADDRIGGMSAHFEFNGLNIERFYHFICRPDTAYFRVLDELGIADRLVWRPTGMGYYNKGELHPWGTPLALLRFPGLDIISKIRYGLHIYLSTRRNSWKDIDKLDAVHWIKRFAGNKAYDLLWRSLFELKFFEYTNHMSAAWIWTRIKRVGLSRNNFFQEQLGYLKGGSADLLNALNDAVIRSEGKIHLNSPVEKIKVKNNRVSSVTVKGREISADCVISTIPLPLLPSILEGVPDPIVSQYSSLINLPVVCVIAGLRQKVTENFWLNISDDRFDIPGIIEYSNLNPLDNKSGIVYIPFYMPHTHPDYKKGDDYFISKAVKYLKMINPEITDDKITDLSVSRYRYAQPVYPPGYSDRIPSVNPGIEGLYMADTSCYYPEDRSISESMKLGINMAKMAVDKKHGNG